MLSVLCYWTNGIVPLPWTLVRGNLSDTYEMSYGPGGVIRSVYRKSQWKVFHVPARIDENIFIRYDLERESPLKLANLETIALDDLDQLISRKSWKKLWCKGMDNNYYLGMDWMKRTICKRSIEIIGADSYPRWYDEPKVFFETGIQGVVNATTAVVNFVTKDIWEWIISFLIDMGWYVLYCTLGILGLMLILIIVKCSCNALGRRICSRNDKMDQLAVLEKLVNLQGSHLKKKRTLSEKSLL